MTFSKYFTPAEATKTLPLVRAIVNDILQTASTLREIQKVYDNSENHQKERAYLQQRLYDYVKELAELGCLYKDWNFSVGLVDFPAIIDGEEVLLCWKSDEPDLMYYHSLQAGFAGRKKIPSELFDTRIVVEM